jgi:hypothetical protein
MNILWSLSTTGQPLVLCPFECNEIVVRGLAGLWAAGHDLKLVVAGPSVRMPVIEQGQWITF